MSEEQPVSPDPRNPRDNARSTKTKLVLVISGLALALTVGLITSFVTLNASISSAQALENFRASMKPFEDRSGDLVNEINTLREQGVGDGSFAVAISAVSDEWSLLTEEVGLVETQTAEIAEAHGFFTQYMSDMGKAYDYYAIGLETSDVEMIYLGNDYQDEANGSLLQYAASLSLLESKEKQGNE